MGKHLEQIDRLLEPLEALQDVRDVLKVVGDIDTAVERAQARLDELSGMCAEEQEKLKAIVDDVGKARAEAKATREQAAKDASDCVKSGEMLRENLVQQAREEAAKMIAEAKSDADRRRAKAEGDIAEKVNRAEDRLTELAEAIGEATAAKAKAEAALSEKQAELERINAALAEARARIGV